MFNLFDLIIMRQMPVVDILTVICNGQQQCGSHCSNLKVRQLALYCTPIYYDSHTWSVIDIIMATVDVTIRAVLFTWAYLCGH